MNVKYLSLLLLMPSMQAMQNQVTPAPALTDAQIVAQALPAIVNISEELIPHLATAIKSNPEAADITTAVVQGASAALSAQSKNSVSKTNAAYIATAAGALTSIITARASAYASSSSSKC